MAIGASIERGLALFEEATSIFNRVKTAVSDGVADVGATDLKSAQERLAAAMEKAQAAHDGLNEAIDARLNAGG